MKERPILFSAPMVRAILAGTKTQTRRVVKIPGVMPRTSFTITHPDEEIVRFDDGTFHYLSTAAMSGPYACPYGQPGDRLWVRETWGTGSRPDPFEGWRDGIEYRADDFDLDEHDLLPLHHECVPDDVDLSSIRSGWRPSIHMPRWASRITLEITDVHVERLQDISEADARSEGVTPLAGPDDLPGVWTGAFERLWDSINGTGAWLANPWVWVVSFQQVQA